MLDALHQAIPRKARPGEEPNLENKIEGRGKNMYVGLLRITRTGVPETAVMQERDTCLVEYLCSGYQVVSRSFSASLIEDILSEKLAELDRI